LTIIVILVGFFGLKLLWEYTYLFTLSMHLFATFLSSLLWKGYWLGAKLRPFLIYYQKKGNQVEVAFEGEKNDDSDNGDGDDNKYA